MDNGSILIVEDESMVSEFLRTQLEKSNYQVVDEVKTGEEAIEVVDEKDVDIILMDIKLDGELNGVETARKINQNHELGIIYVTAYSESSLIEEAKLTEPSGYLIKPIEQDDLLCTLAIARHNQMLIRERKQALEERDQALKEKEELLEKIEGIVENNLEVMGELMELQKMDEGLLEADGLAEQGLEVIESITELRDTFQDFE